MSAAAELDRGPFGRVMAVINGKGGVLKTTLAANIAGLLAQSGLRILLVDLDPQGNVGTSLGYRYSDDDDDGRNLAAALGGFQDARPVQARPNLEVMPGGSQLRGAAASLVSTAGRDPDEAKAALARALAPIVSDYDFALIDCPPGDEMLQNTALAAARWALVPTHTDRASTDGLAGVASRFDSVLGVNPDLDLLGIVLTDVDSPHRRGDRILVSQAEQRARADIDALGLGERVFARSVRHSNETASLMRERGRLAHELDADRESAPTWWKVRRGEADKAAVITGTATSVAEDLLAITEEIMRRITRAEAVPEGVGA